MKEIRNRRHPNQEVHVRVLFALILFSFAFSAQARIVSEVAAEYVAIHFVPETIQNIGVQPVHVPNPAIKPIDPSGYQVQLTVLVAPNQSDWPKFVVGKIRYWSDGAWRTTIVSSYARQFIAATRFNEMVRNRTEQVLTASGGKFRKVPYAEPEAHGVMGFLVNATREDKGGEVLEMHLSYPTMELQNRNPSEREMSFVFHHSVLNAQGEPVAQIEKRVVGRAHKGELTLSEQNIVDNLALLTSCELNLIQ